MKCSIDIVHVRWHTCQHSTIQNQEISGGLLYCGVFWFHFVKFQFWPLGARLVLLLKEWAFTVHGNIYVNRITLILCSRSQLLHDNIHTVIKNMQTALELKMLSSTTFTLCDLSRHCVIFQDQILTMFSIL